MSLGPSASFRHSDAVVWAHQHNQLWAAAAVGYVVFVFAGQALMKRRAALELRPALVAWNAALAIFSLLGSIGTVKDTVSAVGKHGYRGSWCESDGYFDGTSGFWAFAFTISKLFELGDTIFLVLRKRPVMFLHWYHHVSVLLITWSSYPMDFVVMRWGVTMNYLVHTIMYSYFAARAYGLKLPKPLASSITTLQLAQFAIALGILVDAFIQMVTGSSVCANNQKGLALAYLTLYASYFGLFAQFFVAAYCGRSKKHD